MQYLTDNYMYNNTLKLEVYPHVVDKNTLI